MCALVAKDNRPPITAGAPDVISIEELSDNGLTDPYDALKERRTRFAEVALQLRREELPLTLDRIDHQLNYDALHELRHLAR
jgi:hypothetical protein